jgi:phosphatidate cytidylyltransferase
MLATRLVFGALLGVGGVLVLVMDTWLGPYYPVMLLSALGSLLVCSYEFVHLLPPPGPRPWLCYSGVVAMLLANWPAHLFPGTDPWHWILGAFLFIFLALFVAEGEAFRKPGGAVARLGLSLLLLCYLGLLPAFLVQLRWLDGWEGTVALALAIFVPKLGDVGAFFVGRTFGRSRMTPVLSPGKTWEGFLGGMLVAVAVAVGLNQLSSWLLEKGTILSWSAAVGFGITVGLMGVLGDLMESLIKRDVQKKDASNLVPGFGGLLDVLDSVLFSAPVAYAWFVLPEVLTRTGSTAAP